MHLRYMVQAGRLRSQPCGFILEREIMTRTEKVSRCQTFYILQGFINCDIS